jgi:hypothetical protein
VKLTKSYDVLAEVIQIQIVLIIPEGILDLLSSDKESEEDIAGQNGSGDSDPSEWHDELEGKSSHIETSGDP